MSDATHAAVVLAAGGSQRLGHAKQLLRRDGETLVHRMVRLAASTRPQRLLLVTGAESQAIADAAAGLGAEVLHNPDWAQGLASSLQRAAAALSGFDGAVLLLGCDQPALDAHHLQALLRGAGTASSGCAATVHGDAAGIPALVTMALMQASTQLQGDRGLGARLTSMADAVWRMDAPELRLDIDHEDDVTAALALGLLDR
ncbi:NTP transferase domain-containing protein [Lysobacter sp. GCM10012299]|uniref:nucleotidyltransferase family protein n=1 Tax=Lysobacter sp. GCM10012299 TaxID=3317333 RepID=UPI00361CD8A3